MPQFEPGKIIKTNFGSPIKIIKYLASGGQGDVYVVDYGGNKKALKWYKTQVLRDSDAFYENLKRNAEKGAPDKAFLWPDAVTEKINGSFGYIMDLRPDGYYELGKILASPKYIFTSFKSAIDACIAITNAFRKLHNYGYCYSVVHDGNFFIDPNTGDVLICDSDNVAPNGTNTGVIGKPRYMAPEIVTGDGKVIPDVWSDRFSLSVILFIILFMSHPLEGARWLVPCMTDSMAKKLYGSEPLFIYDPDDASNRPIDNIHGCVIDRWKAMPDFLKEMCTKAFSKQSLLEPCKRPREMDWLEVLVRLRSCVIRCSCGSEIFVDGMGTYKCNCCGETINIKNELVLPMCSIVASKGMRIYRCQLGICNVENALEPMLLVVANSEGKLGVKNMTSNTLKAFTPSCKEKAVEPGMIVPLIPGISIEICDKTIKLT